jgi:hypothetical protein
MFTKLLVFSVLLAYCFAANKNFDVSMPRANLVTIPDDLSSAIYCQIVPFDNQGKPWQITKFDPQIDGRNDENIGFIALWGIRRHASADILHAPGGYTPNCYGLEYGMVFQGAMDYIYFWKRGMNKAVTFDNDEGMPFGNQTDYAYFLLEISYTNIDTPQKKNFYDETGVTVRMTDNIRPYNVAFLTLGMNDALFQMIPTFQASWSFNSSVVVDSDYLSMNQDPEMNVLYNIPEAFKKMNITSAQVISILGHTMIYGTSVDMYLWKNGTAPGDVKKFTTYTALPVDSGPLNTGTPIGKPQSLGRFLDPFWSVKSWDSSIRDREIYISNKDSISISCTYNTVEGKYGQFDNKESTPTLPCKAFFGTDCEMVIFLYIKKESINKYSVTEVS